jgi:RHS repeat-associated protein
VAAVLDGQGRLLEYYTGDIGLGGTVAATHTAQSWTQGTYYVRSDHRGDIVSVRSGTSTVASLSYAPFGELRTATGSYTPRFRFSSKEYEATVGLSYFGYRWYDPTAGVWTTKDPLGIAGGLNAHRFCNNSPINYIDPFGLVAIYIHGIWFPDTLDDMANTVGGNHRVYKWSGSLTATALEHVNIGGNAGRFAEYIQQVSHECPGEPIDIVAYSGGGMIAINAAEMLSDVKIRNLILMGAPVSEWNISNVGKVWDFTSWSDPLSWNIDYRGLATEVNFSGINHLEWFTDSGVAQRVQGIVTK